MTVGHERRAAFLEEMGLGPTWVRRNAPATVAEAPAAAAAGAAPDAFATLETPAPQVFDVGARPVDAIVQSIGAMNWSDLEQAVSTCARCSLCAGRSKTVFGGGDRKANWLFIGDGPGREEDERGQVFAGRAGQLLDSMLAAMQLGRGQNAYVANIVKCRPTDANGDDRRSSAVEQATCMAYLERQIALIQPTALVALGQVAAAALLGLDPETPLSGLRGRVHRFGERPLIVTHHPADLLRAPADKREAWADLCLAMAEYANDDSRAVGAPSSPRS